MNGNCHCGLKCYMKERHLLEKLSIFKTMKHLSGVSKNHLGSIQIIFIWRRKTVVHFTKLSIRLCNTPTVAGWTEVEV